MRTLKRILGVLLIFVFGAVVGSVVTGAGITKKIHEMISGGPEAFMDVIVARLDHDLKLDGEQKRKVRDIVGDARIKLRQSRAKYQPEIEETLQEAGLRTRAILYPEQVKKFDDLITRSRAKWKGFEAPSQAAPLAAATPVPSTPVPATPAPAEETAPGTKLSEPNP